MIYLRMDNGQHVIILEPGNIDEIKNGKVARTPNGEVGILYTPDINWFGTQLMERSIVNNNGLDMSAFDQMHKESLERPEVRNTPKHPNLEIIRDGKVQGHHD